MNAIPRGRRRERGTVLIVAMIIIFALVAMVIVLGRSVRVEATASANGAAGAEATLIARGAEQYVLAVLEESTEPWENLDESAFAAVPVGAGYFWLLRPDYDDPTLAEFGLVDESCKVDLNRVTRDALLYLPGMTEEVAGAIIDWRDEDGEMETAGAENETYLQLSDGYVAKNAPFETVEEMLLLNGMTRALLYGPTGQQAEGDQGMTLGQELYQTMGLHEFFTAWGGETTLDPDGEERVNVNGQDNRQALTDLLTEKLGASRAQTIIGTMGDTTFRGIIDFGVRAGLTLDEFQAVEMFIRAEPASQQGQQATPPPMRININGAPREVMLTLEGLDESDVDTLLARRPLAGSGEPASLAWVLDAFGDREANREKLSDLSNQVAGRGAFVSADIVAIAGNGRAFRRVRIVVDVRSVPSKIVYRRDITGRGWPLDPGIRQSLRSGTGIGT